MSIRFWLFLCWILISCADSPCQGVVLNEGEIIQRIWQTPEYKLMQEAGVSCVYEIRLKVSSALEVIRYKVQDPCHPLYEKLMEEYLDELEINPESINSERRYTWITWRIKFRLFD